MSTKPLSEEQVAFAECIAVGRTRTDAFKLAFPKRKVKFPHQTAAKVAKDARVIAKVEEFRALMRENNIFSRQDAIDRFTALGNEARKAGDMTTAWDCVRGVHDALCSWYTPAELKEQGMWTLIRNMRAGLKLRDAVKKMAGASNPSAAK